MNIKLILTFTTILIFSGCISHQKTLKEKYPDGLLTNDYGILKKEDLLYDIKLGSSEPYDINKFQPGYYRWQCFPKKDVTFNYDTWKDNDPLGRFDVIVTLCFFGIKVKTEKLSHVYMDRRARRVEFCQEIQKEWKRLTQDQSHLCLNGQPDDLEDKEKHWTWNKMKTHNGCLSLFDGDCNTTSGLKDLE